MKTLNVNVTKTDIKKGNPSQASYCPVALALKRTGKYDYASVTAFDISLATRKGWMEFKTPKIVCDFIWNFDLPSGQRVENSKPFKFTLTEKDLIR